MIRNQAAATLLENLAELLEAKNESVFRIGAYRRAAQRISSWPEDIETVWHDGRLDDIPGVGESIAAKIDEFLRTGRLAYLEELRGQVAPGLATLLLVPGIGTRRARIIWDTLGIRSIADGVIREARLRNVALEIDSQPERLDLDDTWARRAKDAGVLLAVDSDAHDANQLRLVRYGIPTARRGWVERRHVLNALPLEALLANRRPHSVAA